MQLPTRLRRQWRSIGGTALAAGAAAFAWRRWHGRGSLALLVLAAALLGLALAWPRAWAPVERALNRAARGLTAAVTWILLGAVFLVCFVPGRLLLVLLRRDPLRRAWEPARSSYWEPLPPAGGAERFRRQF